MSNFRVFETNQFLSDLQVDFKGQNKRIKEKLRAFVYPRLKEQPCFGPNIRKLKNYRPEMWRYRIGSFRFFYEIDEKLKMVKMISADNRQDIY